MFDICTTVTVCDGSWHMCFQLLSVKLFAIIILLWKAMQYVFIMH